MAAESDKPKSPSRPKRKKRGSDFSSNLRQKIRRIQEGKLDTTETDDATPPPPSPDSQEPHTPSPSIHPITTTQQSPWSILTMSHAGSPGQSNWNADHEAAGQQSKQPRKRKTISEAVSAEPEGTQNRWKDLAINVGFEMDVHGAYLLKLSKVPSSTDENEGAKQLAQSAAMQLLQAETLSDMGEQLLAQYRASLQSIFAKSAPRSLTQ